LDRDRGVGGRVPADLKSRRRCPPGFVQAISFGLDRHPLRRAEASGPDLAGQALKAGLVDECHLFLTPIVVGGGKQAFPDHVCVKLELLDERRFGNGMLHIHYRTGG